MNYQTISFRNSEFFFRKEIRIIIILKLYASDSLVSMSSHIYLYSFFSTLGVSEFCESTKTLALIPELISQVNDY